MLRVESVASCSPSTATPPVKAPQCVTLRVEEGGHVHYDSLDLYSARARQSFIDAASEMLGAGESAIGHEVGEIIAMLERERLAMRSRGASEVKPSPTMTAEEREEAMAMNRSPRLLEILREDFLAIGCVGEWESMLPAYLAALSRKLDSPLSVLFCARSGAGKSNMQEKIASLVPPEDLVSYTRITGQALFYKDENALVHKLLAIDEEDGAAAASYALRSLQSAGYLASLYTRTDPRDGKQKSEECRVSGPASIFSTTAHPEALDFETRNRFLILTADESKDQTARILEAQRRSVTLEGLIGRQKREAVIRRNRNAQRLIERLEVVLPDELALRFPKGRLIFRREHGKYLTLIRSMALLHQHQRGAKSIVVEGKRIEYIEATLADVEAIHELAMALLRRSLDELSPPARVLARAIRDMVRGRPRLTFDRKELQGFTGLSMWHIKTYLVQLCEYDYIAPLVGKKGTRYLYELLWDGVEEEL